MKFALASYGTRGDIEPCAAIGRELLRRGHEVRLAVPPDLVSFVQSAGIAAVPYGLDTQAPMDAQRRFYHTLLRRFWRVPDLVRMWREVDALVDECWRAAAATLLPLSEGADLLFTGLIFEQTAANVAEHYRIPLATLHYFPVRANGQLHPILPSPLTRTVITTNEWLAWHRTRKVEDAQRAQLGLPKATRPCSRRITERGSLELQAYDEICFPGLASEWSALQDQRPFIGNLTLELGADSEDEVASWITAGKPPIYFGFGSMPVESPSDTFAMINAAAAQLGERALICAGWSDFTGVVDTENVKIVSAVNFPRVFPACRAIVHHGGSGTTAAALRAGVPAVILWTDIDPIQAMYGAQIKQLGVGTTRRLKRASTDSLVADLQRILAPDCVSRAKVLAARMVSPSTSVELAADLLEDRAGLSCLR